MRPCVPVLVGDGRPPVDTHTAFGQRGRVEQLTILQFSAVVFVGSIAAGLAGRAHRPRRRHRGDSDAHPAARRRHPLRRRRVAGLGDRHLVGRRVGVRQARASPTCASACSSRSPPPVGAVVGALLTGVHRGLDASRSSSASCCWRRPRCPSAPHASRTRATTARSARHAACAWTATTRRRAGRGAYHVHGVPPAFGIMFVAGALSGLLGIGSGAVKVLALDQAMRLPFKVSTTTSNFMIGVTAAASAGVYLHRGYIDPGLAMPVMLGVLVGALLGARVLVRVQRRRPAHRLRRRHRWRSACR